MQIDTTQVAVLAERVDRMLADYQELRGLIMSQSAVLGNVSVMQTTIAEHDRKLDRAFNAIRDNSGKIAELEKQSNINSWTWRLTGAVLVCCVGLIGWGWREGKTLYVTDATLDRRTLLIEYKLGIRHVVPEGEKQ